MHVGETVRRVASVVMLISLLLSMWMFARGASEIRSVKASGIIYIRADGSVDPPTAPIYSADNTTYTLTGDTSDSIVVERSNIIIDGNDHKLEDWGFNLTSADNVTIKNAIIRSFGYGIWANSSLDLVIRGNNITGQQNGICLLSSSNNTIIGNNVTTFEPMATPSFENGAIYLYNSRNNTICGNKVQAPEWPWWETTFALWYSDHNIISENNLTNSGAGIRLFSSSNNIITNNYMADNHIGVDLSRCSDNILRNNTMVGNSWNFGSWGESISECSNDVDTSNTVDGKPIYYFVNMQDLTVPVDAGYVALVNCTRMTVQDLELTHNMYGMSLAFTTTTTIRRNNFTSNMYGMLLVNSTDNVIYWNDIEDTYYGCCGVFVRYSQRNTVYHNNFIDCAAETEGSSDNVWYVSQNCEGNYWTFYSGVDSDYDGIGDTPYDIDDNNRDHYPLMNRYWNPADINHDLRVDLKDYFTAALAYGSWNPHADITGPEHLVPDWKIDLRDIYLIALEYGKTYQ